MTWYIDPETGDVYDHNGDRAGSIDGPSISDGDIVAAMREAMDSDGPTLYNQVLLADMATRDFERGLPPSQR
jgi:hypothetical protein